MKQTTRFKSQFGLGMWRLKQDTFVLICHSIVVSGQNDNPETLTNFIMYALNNVCWFMHVILLVTLVEDRRSKNSQVNSISAIFVTRTSLQTINMQPLRLPYGRKCKLPHEKVHIGRIWKGYFAIEHYIICTYSLSFAKQWLLDGWYLGTNSPPTDISTQWQSQNIEFSADDAFLEKLSSGTLSNLVHKKRFWNNLS